MQLIKNAALTAADEGPFPGAVIDIMTFDIEVFPDQETVKLNGTFEEVVAQAKKLNPEFALAEVASPVAGPSQIKGGETFLSLCPLLMLT